MPKNPARPFLSENRSQRTATACLTLCALLAAGAPSLAWAGAEDEKIESHKRELADVEQRVSDLELNIGSNRDRRHALLTELERHERNIADLARAGHQLKAMIAEQKRAVEELRSMLATEREALKNERAALGGLLRSAYTLGKGDQIRMLLDQDDPNRLSRIMGYYGHLNRYRIERIKSIGQRAFRLERLAHDAEDESARLSLLAKKQDETRAGLALAQKGRAALLAALDRSIATQAESIASLRAQARELGQLLRQLEERARALPEAELDQASLGQLRGQLAWPLAHTRVLSRFGSLKPEGSQTWDGVVLATEEGAEVRAVHNGRVVYADWLRGFGLLLIIEHEGGFMTLYGNNQALLKEPGEWVAAGDTIALSGSSGGQASPGLYFAIRRRGKPVNPEKWCQGDTKPRRSSSTLPSHLGNAGALCRSYSISPSVALGSLAPAPHTLS